MSLLFLRLRRRFAPSRRALCALCAVVLSCLLLFFYFNRRLLPVAHALAEEKARSLAIGAVDEALSQVLLQEGALLTPHYDSSGRLTHLVSDTAAVNRLRTRVSRAVTQALETADKAELSVPIGSLFDSPLLSARGPKITVGIGNISTAVVTLSERFSSAGINQTLFTLSCDVTVKVNLFMPFYRQPSTLSFSCPVTQFVITGQVPSIYVPKGSP